MSLVMPAIKPLIIHERGPIKLTRQGDKYLVLNGVRIEKQYTSQTWAEKKFNRLNQVFTKE